MRDPQHLETVAIRRFRGLSTLDLEGLGAFNVFLGANDVGKTSVLEAIFLLSGVDNLQLPVMAQNLRQYLVSDFGQLSPLFHEFDIDSGVKLTARASQERRTLTISAPYQQDVIEAEAQRATISAKGKAVGAMGNGRAGDQSSSALSGPRALRYDATVQPVSQEEPLRTTGTLVDRGDKWEVMREPDSVIDTRITASFLPALPGYDNKPIGELIVRKRTDVVLKYLQVVNPRVEQIAVIGDIVYVDIGLAKLMPLNMFGSGMIRAATILSACILGDHGILLIDEIEYGLHHEAIPQLLAALLTLSDERSIQVFVTTHSLDVLRGLQALLSEQRFSRYRPTTLCYKLARDVRGLVRSYRYDHHQFGQCIQSGMEIR